MAINLHDGIILRSFIPKKQKLTILDSKLGRIECIPSNHNISYKLSNGGYIGYLVKLWKEQYYTISDVQIIEIPFYWGKNNLLFFHHVLELCDYFLPFDSQSTEIFNLVVLLYTHPEKFQSLISKKLFLCNFFKMLGIYPIDMDSYDSVILNLISEFLHSNLNYTYEISVDSDLRRWLFACINVHPQAHRLKTIEFLNEQIKL